MTEDENVKKVKEQGERYYVEAKVFEASLPKNQIEWLYLINTLWLEKWKKYCDFRYIESKNKHPEIYKLKAEKKLILNPELFPGAINNADILIPFDSFVNTKDTEDLSNFILKPDAKLNVDFTVISEEMWRIFLEGYGGGPAIQKPLDKYKFYKASIGGYSACLSVLFIPSREIISKEIIDSMELHQFCFELPVNGFEIKEHIRYCLNHKNNAQLRMILLGQEDETQESKIDVYYNLKGLPIDQLKQLLLNNLEAINEGKTIDINSVLSVADETRLMDCFNNDQFVLCEYYQKSSLFFNSVPQEGQVYPQPDSRNDYQYNHSSDYEQMQYINDGYEGIQGYGNGHKGRERRQKNKYDQKEWGHHAHSPEPEHYDIKNKVKFDAEKNKNGLVGLTNLGNTCYMNTSLQCLSNLFELSTYFLKDIYKNDLVVSNKKESNTFIEAYADVIKAMWYGNQNNFPPSQFKSTIHLLNKMFYGYNQHDMHEFICFLLDTLHEGLNTAKNSKTESSESSNQIEPITSNSNSISESNGNDDELSKIEKKNKSIVSSLIFGLLRSTVLCPNEQCSNISITYEPYTTLSLPLAQDSLKTTKLMCFMIFYDISIPPIEFFIWINSATTIDAFRAKVGGLFRIRNDSFLITKLQDDFIEINPETTFSIESFLFCDKPLFLLQISPEVFGESFDSINHLKTIYKEIKENDALLDLASQQEDSENHDDLNTNKFDPMKSIDNTKWIKGTFYQYGYSTPKKEHEPAVVAKNRLVFPRIIFINKEWTIVQLYNILIDYFASFYSHPKEELFANIETLMDKSVANKKAKEKNSPIPLPFILLYEDTREKKVKPLRVEDGWNEQIVPYDGSVKVLLSKKLPMIEDYSKHVLLFKIAWLKEYEPKVKNLNERERLLYIPSIRKKGGLDKCIEKFIVKEQLNEDNKWNCPKCRQDQLANKIIEIVKLPTYLILHLKRFNHQMKIDTEIDFPIKGLDMRHYAQVSEEEKAKLVYDLVAIGNHSGGLHGGHYYAFAKNHSADQWYEFNDSYVRQMNEKDLMTSNAYVLFYKKR